MVWIMSLISGKPIFIRLIFLSLASLSIAFLLVSLAASGMPASFYQAMTDMNTSNYLCVKNYDAGASVTESYSDFDHLEKETEINSRSFHPSGIKDDSSRGNATLEARIASSVIGKAHIAWQSKDVKSGPYGRHAVYGLVQEDLIGVLNIERFIHLSSNDSYGFSGPDWLPCS